VAEADPCAFWNVAASKVVTPLFSLKPFPDATITAVDIRETNLQKAKFILLSSGITNVRLTKENLNEPSAALAQQYDAIFCVGLLYHLRQPAQFLARAAQAAGFCGFLP